MAKTNYNNESIQALKGADRVRLRPSVIFGSDGILGCKHSVFEILSNSIDEAREGYGKEITLIHHKDHSITVIDQGRGIPVGYNKKEKKYNWELLFTELYAGGKYNNNEANNYEYSLGINGLGLCATQYASEFMDVQIKYDKTLFTLHFESGNNIGGLKKKKIQDSQTGTKIHWKPDLKVFTAIEIEKEYFLEMLKEQAVVNKGVTFIYINEMEDLRSTFYYENGIEDYVKELSLGKNFTPIVTYSDNGEGRDRKDREKYRVKCEVSFAFNNAVNALKYFHNSSSLTHGGSPDLAVKTAFMYEIDKFIKKYDKYKKNEKMINFTDIEDSLIIIINSFSSVTSYENQTKKSINNAYIKRFLTDSLRAHLEIFFTENPKVCEKVLDQVLINKRSREKAELTRKSIKKKLSVKNDVTSRPKKFVDCREKDPSKRELYIVEGDSALGACKLSRDASFQALMPVRGKILNTLKSDYSKIVKSDIIMDLMQVIGTGIEYSSKKTQSTFNIEDLQYDKIIIATDADVDGFHIRSQILTMFYSLAPRLLKEGRVYIVESPLYEIVHKNKSYFAYSDQEKNKIVESIKEKVSVHRSKGLGENEPEMMWLTTMNPASRKLIQVCYEESEFVDNVFDALLGDDIVQRKFLIETKGNTYREYLDLS